MHRLLRIFWTFLAIVFLVEAWLWDRLEPIVAFVVARIPLQAFKARVAAWIDHLPPAATLLVFLVPVVLLFPLKLVGLWMLSRGDWAAATGVLVFAKLVGVGVTAFVFDVTREKLLLLAWFRWIYVNVMACRAWAHRLVDPIKRRIKARLRMFAPRRASRAMRLLFRIRRRMHATVKTDAPHAVRTAQSP
jgi:hypothetical protein